MGCGEYTGVSFLLLHRGHPLDNEAIRRCYEKMEPLFEGLPRDASNQLFQNIAAVCIEYELAAFTEGLRVGAALERELRSE